MGRRNAPEERINFVLTGDLAIWLGCTKEHGYFINNPEAVRQGLILLRDNLRKLGINVTKEKKEED